MKTILSLILMFHFLPATAQINVVKFKCADSVRFITNAGSTQDCEFYFDNENPNIFYVENFTHKDFYNVIYNKDETKLARVKLVTTHYTPSIHDFVYSVNKEHALLFYYILKDSKEEQKIFYHD